MSVITNLCIFYALSTCGPLLLHASAQPTSPVSPKPGNSTASPMRDGEHDFDFWIGNWKVQNRRLRNPLTGSTEWYEFDGTVVAKPLWGGRGNFDEGEFNDPGGHIQGMTLRLYNPQSHQWSLYWATSAKGVLEPPMAGAFAEGRGEFFDQEEFHGRSIYVRYVWSEITPTSCHWEQAFSPDGGKTWETNWTMAFERQK